MRQGTLLSGAPSTPAVEADTNVGQAYVDSRIGDDTWGSAESPFPDLRRFVRGARRSLMQQQIGCEVLCSMPRTRSAPTLCSFQRWQRAHPRD